MRRSFSFNWLLMAFFAFIAMLLAVRFYFSHSFLFLFLVWNLFLAWIPCQLAGWIVTLPVSCKKISWLLFGAWLLFFPNALYLVTDLIHLDIDSGVPKWFDAVLLFTTAITGLLMAYNSLFRIEYFLLRNGIRPRYLQPSILLILFMGAFGVYLGRFQRWNSWDIIHHPAGLFSAVTRPLFFPYEHLYTWGVTVLLTALFYLFYWTIKKFPASMVGNRVE